MEECAQCGERAVDYDEQALALVCARCGHVADEAQLTSRVEFDELGRAGGVRVGGGGAAGDGGEPRSWMWTAGAGGGRFGGGWGEGAETKWGGGGKSAEFKRRKNKVPVGSTLSQLPVMISPNAPTASSFSPRPQQPHLPHLPCASPSPLRVRLPLRQREWEERLGAVVAGLRVPEGVRGDAVGVAERVLEGRWGSGQWMNVLMAAAVYIAARNRRLPVSMGEVAIAAAALLLVAGARGVVLGEGELCAAMGVPPATVRQRFSELTRAVTGLARSLLLPGANSVSSQPAFHRLLPSILALLPSPARVGHRFVMPSADVGRRADVEDRAADVATAGGKRAKRSIRCFDEGGGGEAKRRQGQGSGNEEGVVDWLLLQQADPRATASGWYRSAASTVMDRHVTGSTKQA
ncbi:unnamed protein product [Closterium sp. Yama58-4]|nr:unnamed protein product [Closterium sp. Yama58-4]